MNSLAKFMARNRIIENLPFEGFEEIIQIDRGLTRNPLIGEIDRILGCVEVFKERARSFYFEVALSPFQCPECGGHLKMTGTSECACACGNMFDPTIAFQKSLCCGSGLTRKTFHYSCRKCGKITPSRFIFDETLFDADYFRDMMRKSREKSRQKKQMIRQLLAQSRSNSLQLLEEPRLETIPDLIQDLHDFIKEGST